MEKRNHSSSATEPADACGDWASIRHAVTRAVPASGINMAHAAVTRHAGGPLADRPALCWLPEKGAPRVLTYGTLERLTNRVANGLVALGLRPGQVVASLCERTPELYITALAALKAGGVFCALYATYGPEPVRYRLAASGTAILLTTSRQYAKIQDLRPQLPDLTHVLVIDTPLPPAAGITAFQSLMQHPRSDFTIVPTDPETPALIHFSSGTTGMPKGVVHVHAATLHHILTARTVLDLTPGDIYWCTADPGWVTGVVYGFLAPLMAGATAIVDGAEFDAARWLAILSDRRVNVWYTSPSALRRLMALPVTAIKTGDLSALRLAFSVGEPLHAAVVEWSRTALGTPIRDTWWQTETGGIIIAAHPHTPVRPGVMGRPVTGIRAAVLRPAGTPGGGRDVCAAGEIGELALAAGWPSMFRRLLGDTDAYAKRFCGEWYLSGDLVRREDDGSFRFVGRADDMIKTAGHLVSPFEVEAVLLAHPDVSDAAVVGTPDPHLGQRVTAHLCLRTGAVPDEALRRRIMVHARQRLGPALAPRRIVFTGSMPRNPAGKIVRRQLIDAAGPDS